MVLSEGQIVEIGDPGGVARRYFRLNLSRPTSRPLRRAATAQPGRATARRLAGGPDGKQDTSVEQREQIRLRALLEAQRAVPGRSSDSWS